MQPPFLLFILYDALGRYTFGGTSFSFVYGLGFGILMFVFGGLMAN
jgi:hypothetical protein